MKTKNALAQIKPLLKRPYFTSRDARERGVSASLLAHYVRTGDLERIERGIYRSVNAPLIDDFRWEDLIYVMAKIKDGVICYTTALTLYELTDDIPRQHWIAIRHGTRHRAMQNVRVVRMRNLDLGRTTINIDGYTLSIFDRERTIIDAFKFLGLETAIKALRIAINQKGEDAISINKLRLYADKLHFNIQPYLLMVTT